MRILLSIAVLQEPYNTSPSPDPTSLTRFNKFVFTCMHPAQNTCLLSSAFSVMFRVPYTLDYTYHHLPSQSLSLTLMLIGVDVLTPDVPPLGTAFFFVTTLSLGPEDNLLFLVLVLKPNIEVLLMLYLSHVGFVIFYWSFIFLFLRPLWCIVTMLMPFISLVILCNISAPNILKWTFTLYGKR